MQDVIETSRISGRLSYLAASCSWNRAHACRYVEVAQEGRRRLRERHDAAVETDEVGEREGDLRGAEVRHHENGHEQAVVTPDQQRAAAKDAAIS